MKMQGLCNLFISRDYSKLISSVSMANVYSRNGQQLSMGRGTVLVIEHVVIPSEF